MYSGVMLSVVMVNDVMLSAIILSVVMLRALIVGVFPRFIMLSGGCHYTKCCYTELRSAYCHNDEWCYPVSLR